MQELAPPPAGQRHELLDLIEIQEPCDSETRPPYDFAYAAWAQRVAHLEDLDRQQLSLTAASQ